MRGGKRHIGNESGLQGGWILQQRGTGESQYRLDWRVGVPVPLAVGWDNGQK